MSLGGIQTPMKPTDTPLVQQKFSGKVFRVLWHKENTRMLQDLNDEANTFTIGDALFAQKWETYDPNKQSAPAAADDSAAPAVPKPAARRRKSNGKGKQA